jgi:hypothetical protein
MTFVWGIAFITLSRWIFQEKSGQLGRIGRACETHHKPNHKDALRHDLIVLLVCFIKFAEKTGLNRY